VADLLPFVLARGEGSTDASPLGGAVTFKALANQTDGSSTAFEAVNPSGEGPPLHVHPAHDEFIYVLDGTLRFRLGDDVQSAPAGSFVFVPRGLQHTWQNVGDSHARFLAWFVPGARGMEEFFAAVVAAEGDPFQTVSSGGAMERVGPPLAESHPL
jgi:quercetin dioxygenase-like cupin family protein